MSIRIFLLKDERIKRKTLRKQKRLEKKELRRKKLSTRKWVLPTIIVSVIGYAALDVFLQIKTNTEISPTLTTCWFSFWGVELWNLASITKKKVATDYEGTYCSNLNQCSHFGENDADEENDEVIKTEESEDEVDGQTDDFGTN